MGNILLKFHGMPSEITCIIKACPRLWPRIRGQFRKLIIVFITILGKLFVVLQIKQIFIECNFILPFGTSGEAHTKLFVDGAMIDSALFTFYKELNFFVVQFNLIER